MTDMDDNNIDNITRGMDCMNIILSDSDNDSNCDSDSDDMDDDYYISNINEIIDFSYDNSLMSPDFDLLESYEHNFTHKQLKTICEYYKIRNVVRGSPNKYTLAAAIVQFEHVKKYKKIVKKRKLFWTYILELASDNYMKQFMLWK
jgi:hypothetical protein